MKLMNDETVKFILEYDIGTCKLYSYETGKRGMEVLQ